jgi:hypothetical protein
MYVFCLILSILPSIDLPSVPVAATNEDRIARLIGQLGSSQFKEREAATHMLDSIGLPALEALKTAARSSDPEVHRRATSLCERIQRRVQTAQLLEAKRLRLAYRKTPVTEAVNDLAHKSGFNIQLDDQVAVANGDLFGMQRMTTRSLMRLVDPGVTLDTGDTTFWQGFDQFCLRVGLVERAPSARKNNEPSRAWNARGLQIQPGVVASPYFASRASLEGRLSLVGGDAIALPTFYAGALRIRAIPRIPSDASTWSKRQGETLVVLEATPEPKMDWQGVVDFRIDHALDEKGRQLVPVPLSRESLAAGLNRNPATWEDDLGRSPTGMRDYVPIRLKLAESASKILRELSGTLAAQMQTAMKDLASIENILQAAGQTARLPENDMLKVLEVERDASGAIRLRLRLEDGLLVAGGVARGRIGWNGRMKNWVVSRADRIQETIDASATHFLLVDAKGQSFRLVGNGSEVEAGARGLAREFTLIYRPRPGQGEPAKLVYSGRCTCLVEVPFALKNVPLQ